MHGLSMHTSYITSKANQGLAFLQRNFLMSSTIKINCYKTFVHPILGYCTVWSSYTIYNINKVKAIQRHAARFVLNDYSRYLNVTAMLSRLSWHTLKIRTKTYNVL